MKHINTQTVAQSGTCLLQVEGPAVLVAACVSLAPPEGEEDVADGLCQITLGQETAESKTTIWVHAFSSVGPPAVWNGYLDEAGRLVGRADQGVHVRAGETLRLVATHVPAENLTASVEALVG